MSLKTALIVLFFFFGAALAQSIRQDTYRDLTMLETIINSRANDFFLMGNGFMWNGLENLLKKKLASKGTRVRILTGQKDAVRFANLARAGAEVRMLPGSISQGPLLAGDLLVGQKNQLEFTVVDSSEMVSIVRTRVSQLFTSSMTKVYKP